MSSLFEACGSKVQVVAETIKRAIDFVSNARNIGRPGRAIRKCNAKVLGVTLASEVSSMIA